MHHLDLRNDGLSEGIAQVRQRHLLANLIASVDGRNAVRLADALLERFGNFSSVLNAPDEAVSVVADDDGTLAHLFRFSRQAARELSPPAAGSSRVSLDNEQFLRYLAAELGCLRKEALLAVFLDSSERYLAKDMIAQGNAICLTFELRTLLRRAVEHDAFGIILAHNHPSGAMGPSASDVAATKTIRDATCAIGIRLHDHFIVAGNNVFSMKRSGHI